MSYECNTRTFFTYELSSWRALCPLVVCFSLSTCSKSNILVKLRLRYSYRLLQLLHFPRELARQITLIDHELFRNITTADILRRVSRGPKPKKGEHDFERTTVELFSDRFNQLSSWIVASLIKEESDEIAAEMLVQFVETAKVFVPPFQTYYIT